jgi:uncharacterized protein YjaG (DUF416 family)
MLPNYLSFHEETGFGDIRLLRGALDAAWCWIETGQMPEETANLVTDCDRQAPNTAEFSSDFTSAALDAASAIATVVESIPHSTKEQAMEVASLAKDTVDVFVQQRYSFDPDDKDLERLIAESELMQTELRCRRKFWRRLSSIKVATGVGLRESCERN